METERDMLDLAEPKRTSEMIAETLIGKIRRGEMPQGEALPTERELCDTFATSRPTVREALTQMQVRGYLTAGAGRRPRATKPSLTSVLSNTGDLIREILGDSESGAHLEQMRQFIETGATREAATRADNLQLTKLRAALDTNFSAIGTPDFAATDIAFHRAIVSVIGNPVLLTLHDMFVSTLLASRPQVDDAAAYDRIAYDEHLAIYQAVLGGDVLAATEVMDRHLARSYRSRLQSPRPASNHNQSGGTP